MDLGSAPDPTDFTHSAQQQQDQGLLVKFYIKARQDQAQTLKQGRPVFKDAEYISIMVPGSRNGVARVATERDKTRFSAHYEAFLKRSEAPSEGTPLAEWPPCAASMVAQLAFFNVKTVEQLAAVPDSKTPNVMGLTNLRELAKRYLKAAESDAPLVQMQAELVERDAKITEQGALITDLMGRLAALEAAGRPEDAPPATEVAAALPEAVVKAAGTYKSVLDGKGEPETEPAPRRRRDKV